MGMINNRTSQEKYFESDGEELKGIAFSMNKIVRKVHECGLTSEVRSDLKDDIAGVADFFSVDTESAVLLCAILEETVSGGCDSSALSRFLGSTSIEFLPYAKRLDEMVRSHILIKRDSRGRPFYSCSPEAISCVRDGKERFEPRKVTGLSTDGILEELRRLFSSYFNIHSDVDNLHDDLWSIVSENPDTVFSRHLLECGIRDCPDFEQRMFLCLCVRYAVFGNQSITLHFLSDLMGEFDDFFRFNRAVKAEHTYFQKKGLVTFGIKDGFTDNESLALTDSVKAKFFTEVDVILEDNRNRRDVIHSEDITKKELFFNPSETEKTEHLAEILSRDNFPNVQERLSELGMRKGFNVLFYGSPGTGKTASVYEIARRTGRDIYMVDLSEMRSKWVGDSEKNVKAVFKTYRDMFKSGEVTPILFFNEADGLFSKRIREVEHSTDQMNNTLQNIILQEMEDMEGILIATTNLEENLDPAFERRFIYKVKFSRPEAEARERIWNSLIPGLSKEDSTELAGRFSFSGGQIENVSRKSAVDYVLSGKRPALKQLISYCQDETYSKKENDRARIGF